MDTIRFNSKAPGYAWLSNFQLVDIEYEGSVYPSVENAYQAVKTLDPAQRLPFRLYRPWAAKSCGQNVTLRDGWTDRFKLNLMRELLGLKYSVPWLRIMLLTTEDRLLIEDTPDPFWGRGRDGLGHNHLGRLHSQIRKTL